MLISGYADYNDYMTSLAASHADIQDSSYGSEDRVLHALKNGKYPLMVWDAPDMSHQGSEDSFSEIWSAGIEVVKVTDRQAFDKQEGLLDDCLNIIRDVRNKLIEDADDNGWDIDISRMRMTPVRSDLLDNAWGWRLDFTFEATMGYCDTSKFE